MIIMSSTLGYAQEGKSNVQPISKLFIKTNFKLPFTTSNTFFKKVGEGVIDMNGSIDYSLMKNFYVGAGYKYAFFKLNERQLNSAPTDQFNGKITLQGFYGELSYFYDVYENFSIEANFQVGRESITTASKFCEAKGINHKKTGLFYSPNVNFYLKGEEVFSFFLSLGYQFSSHGLKPEDMCVDSFTGYNTVDHAGHYQHLNIGFGIGISLVKSSSKL